MNPRPPMSVILGTKLMGRTRECVWPQENGPTVQPHVNVRFHDEHSGMLYLT